MKEIQNELHYNCSRFMEGHMEGSWMHPDGKFYSKNDSDRFESDEEKRLVDTTSKTLRPSTPTSWAVPCILQQRPPLHRTLSLRQY